jgi:hypothetical protein
LPGGETGHPQTNSSADGHPLFWDKPMSSQPGSYPGSQRRKERIAEGA